MDTEIRVSTERRPWRRKFSHRSSRDSNLRPFNHESGALTTELSPLDPLFSPPLSPRLQQTKDTREALTEKLKMATEATLTAEEKAAQMDALLNEEEQNQKTLEHDLKNMRDILFKKQEDMYKVRTQERDLEAVIEVRALTVFA